ncbi:MAG: insulinase family protein [Spirochaetales bacterium]|nr:insulinase family protein [Spirochaetales bacterium]
MNASTTVKRGDTHQGFIVKTVTPLPEFDSVGILCEHEKTGCRLYHIYNDDRENSFCYTFRTPPDDSSGVAHILEHSVLCGSKNFPLKEPFITLAQGSMNTFLNAMTYPDRTLYPASSISETDYFNIMRVYGDSVFFPLLKEIVFMQEGHHLEWKDKNNQESLLEVKGVVFNEMKGHYSTQQSIVSEWSNRSLFSVSPYRVDSGGDPREIISLTYEQFKNFHDTYYHPSNCWIVLHGNIPTEKQLEFLDTHFLQHFSRQAVDSKIIPEPPLKKPVLLEKTAPADAQNADDKKSEITINWLLGENTGSINTQIWWVLEEILLGNAGSPLRRALVDSGLGEDFSSVSGQNTDIKQRTFTVGLRGTKKDSAKKIEEIVFTTLSRLVKEGIPKDIIDAAMNQVEFHTRDYTAGRLPTGLNLVLSVIRGWIYDAPPEETLRFTRLFEEMKKEYDKNPQLFEQAIQHDLIDNTHRSTVVVSPDPHYIETFEKPISDYISQAEHNFTAENKNTLMQKLAELDSYQAQPDSKEALDTIPRLAKKDLPVTALTIDQEYFKTDNKIPVTYIPGTTLGIAYIDCAFNVSGMPSGLFPYIPLFASAATSSGIPGKSYIDVLRDLTSLTGGFFTDLSCTRHIETGRTLTHLFFRTKLLAYNAADAFPLASQCIREADFNDTKRIADILMEKRNGFASRIIPNGSWIAQIRAAAQISETFHIFERMHGVSQFLFLDNLAKQGNEGLADIADKIKQVREYLLSRCPVSMHVSCDTDDRDIITRSLSSLVQGLSPISLNGDNDSAFVPNTSAEALIAPTGIGFVVRTMEGAVFASKPYAAEQILNRLLSTGYLWEHVRMKGGAYGAYSSSFTTENLYSLSSYRDPQVNMTHNAFRAALQYLADGNADEDAIHRALVSVIADAETPLKPGNRGYTQFKRNLFGIDDTMRQGMRDALLSITAGDIRDHSKTLLDRFDSSAIVVLAGEEAIRKAETENSAMPYKRTHLPV